MGPDFQGVSRLQFFEQLGRSAVARLKQLLAVFGGAFGDRATYQDAVPREAYLESFLADERCVTVVAMDGDEAIGGLVAYELIKFEQERKEFYIYDLAVREVHRATAVATGLIVTLKAIARTHGAYVIHVQADRGVLHFDIDPDK